MNANRHPARSLAGLAAVVGVGPTLTVTDIWLCLLPVGLFLSIVSLV